MLLASNLCLTPATVLIRAIPLKNVRGETPPPEKKEGAGGSVDGKKRGGGGSAEDPLLFLRVVWCVFERSKMYKKGVFERKEGVCL